MSFLRHREIYRSDMVSKTIITWGPGAASRWSAPVPSLRTRRKGRAPLIVRDEFPVGYSLASCSPAELASASPTDLSMRWGMSASNCLSANGNLSLVSVSQARGALQGHHGDGHHGDGASRASRGITGASRGRASRENRGTDAGESRDGRDVNCYSDVEMSRPSRVGVSRNLRFSAISLALRRSEVGFERPGLRLQSTPQEADSIDPIPGASFLCQTGQRPNQPADVRRGDCLIVHEDHAGMVASFFRPCLEQWRNRPPVIGNQRQSPGCGFSQAGGVILPEEVPLLPLRHGVSDDRPIPAAEASCYVRRDLLI